MSYTSTTTHPRGIFGIQTDAPAVSLCFDEGDDEEQDFCNAIQYLGEGTWTLIAPVGSSTVLWFSEKGERARAKPRPIGKPGEGRGKNRAA